MASIDAYDNTSLLQQQTQNPAATTIAQQNPWSQFFGSPNGQMELNPLDKYEKQRDDLPKAYVGKNLFLRDTLDQMIVGDNEIFTREILPYMQTELMEVKWRTMQYKPTLMDETPFEGVSRLAKYSEKEQKTKLLRRGMALEVEHGFMKTPEGRRKFGYSLIQIKQTVQETACHDVMYALISCKRHDIEWRKEHGYFNQPIEALIREEANRFGMINKDIRGLDILLARYKSEMRLCGGPAPDTLIMPVGASMYINMIAGGEDSFRFDAMGPAGPARLSKEDTLTAYRGLKVLESRAFEVYDDAPKVDLTLQNFSFGEYYVAADPTRHVVNTINYESACRDIQLFDEPKDQWSTLSFRTLLEKSFRFDNNGNLHFSHARHIQNAGPGGSDDDNNNMFGIKVNGEQRVATYFGQLDKYRDKHGSEKEVLSEKLLQKIAYTAKQRMPENLCKDLITAFAFIDYLNTSALPPRLRDPYEPDWAGYCSWWGLQRIVASNVNIQGLDDKKQKAQVTMNAFKSLYSFLEQVMPKCDLLDARACPVWYQGAVNGEEQYATLFHSFVPYNRNIGLVNPYNALQINTDINSMSPLDYLEHLHVNKQELDKELLKKKVSDIAKNTYTNYHKSSSDNYLQTMNKYIEGGDVPILYKIEKHVGTSIGNNKNHNTLTNQLKNVTGDLKKDKILQKAIEKVELPEREATAKIGDYFKGTIEKDKIGPTYLNWSDGWDYLFDENKNVYCYDPTNSQHYRKQAKDVLALNSDPETKTNYKKVSDISNEKLPKKYKFKQYNYMFQRVTDGNIHPDGPKGADLRYTKVNADKYSKNFSPDRPNFGAEAFTQRKGTAEDRFLASLVEEDETSARAQAEPIGARYMRGDDRNVVPHHKDDPYPPTRWIVDPQELLGRFRSRFNDYITSASICERIITIAFFFTRIHRDSFIRLYDHNIAVPCNFIVTRPFIQWIMGTSIMLKKGASTGVTLVGHSDFMLGDNVVQKMHVGHFTFHLKALVHESKNVILLPGTMFKDYVCGYDSSFLTYDEIEQITSEGYTSNTNRGSILAYMVPYNEVDDIPAVVNVAGKYDPSDPDSAMHFSQYKYYMKHLDLLNINSKNHIQDEIFNQPVETMNTNCLLGSYKFWKQNGFNGRVLSKAHLGNNYPGVATVRNGQMAYYEKVDHAEYSTI